MNNKLTEIVSSLPEIISDLQITDLGTAVKAGGTFHTVGNIKNVKKKINQLNQLADFTALTDNILKILDETNLDTDRFSPPQFNKLQNELVALKTFLASFHGIIKPYTFSQDPNSINIKLPPVNDFEDLSKVSKELHTAISTVVLNEDINGTEQITSVENGSIWINVLVGSGAVTLIGSLIWAASAVYKYILECRIAEEHLRGLKYQHDGMKNVLELQEASIKQVIEAEAKFIQSEHFKDNEAENIEKLKNSIRIFSDLIQKGAEIKPAITSPQDIKSLFPHVEPSLIESKAVKKIENE